MKEQQAEIEMLKKQNEELRNRDELGGRNDRQTIHPLDGNFQGCHKGMLAWNGDFFRVGRFQEEMHGFQEISLGFFDRVPLTRNLQFGTGRHIPFSLMFNDSGQCIGHSGSIAQPVDSDNAMKEQGCIPDSSVPVAVILRPWKGRRISLFKVRSFAEHVS